MSVLHLQGKYVTGEQTEQWRAEGHCEALPLSEIIDVIPDFTLNAMVSSKRLEAEMEKDANVSLLLTTRYFFLLILTVGA